METRLDVLLFKYSRPDSCIDREKVYPAYMVHASTSELLDLVTVRAPERREAAQSKWLKKVRRVSWQTESTVRNKQFNLDTHNVPLTRLGRS
jgi:hypothetical protein